jgi:hypothetical protein
MAIFLPYKAIQRNGQLELDIVQKPGHNGMTTIFFVAV